MKLSNGDTHYNGEITDKTAQEKDTQNENSSTIIIFPDFQKLKDEVEKLRTELSMILLERDELQLIVCKNIETEYMLKLGGLEYKAYELQCAALRLKRKIELIQAKKNRQEKIIISRIEDILDEEFAEYKRKLNEQVENMNEALRRSKSEVLSDDESKELKKMYRKIVKSLHPDLNPEVTEAQLRLFENAVNAYKDGDLETLRIINEMVGDHTLPEKHGDAMTQLVEERKRLERMIKNIRENIDKIKSEYPYSVKSIIEDPEKTAQRKSELESVISQYNEMIDVYKARIEEMLR